MLPRANLDTCNCAISPPGRLFRVKMHRPSIRIRTAQRKCSILLRRRGARALSKISKRQSKDLHPRGGGGFDKSKSCFESSTSAAKPPVIAHSTNQTPACGFPPRDPISQAEAAEHFRFFRRRITAPTVAQRGGRIEPPLRILFRNRQSGRSQHRYSHVGLGGHTSTVESSLTVDSLGEATPEEA